MARFSVGWPAQGAPTRLDLLTRSRMLARVETDDDDRTPTLLTAAPPPFEFSLRTLLLLFVVMGSSLAVFGGGKAWCSVLPAEIRRCLPALNEDLELPTRGDLVFQVWPGRHFILGGPLRWLPACFCTLPVRPKARSQPCAFWPDRWPLPEGCFKASLAAIGPAWKGMDDSSLMRTSNHCKSRSHRHISRLFRTSAECGK